MVPDLVLVLDTETSVDATQRLLFGSWRVFDKQGRCLDEGLFSGDDLPAADLAVLREYVRTHAAASATHLSEPLRLFSRRAFLRQVFWPVAYKARGLVVGYNLPFDLARLGVGWGTTRSPFYAGGFSLILSSYEKHGKTRENRYRPRLAIKSLDSKRALMGFTRLREPDVTDQIPEAADDGQPDATYTFRGHLLDLRTLAFALTNQSHSLASACRAFGVEHGKEKAKEHGKVTPEYLDYNRQDVQATWGLYQKMRAEYDRHPIALLSTQAYSPASIGKAYLEAMGIRPVLERQRDFPKEILGYAMAAYYGGRAECRIRHVSVPVVYLDFLSMYPTVCSLMGLWQLLTCERIEVLDATTEVEALLAGIILDRCFDPQGWRQFVGLVQIVPEGDILPVRAHYGGEATWQIGVNPLTSKEPQWVTIPDAVASTILTGRPPRVLRALHLVPQGRAEGLRPVRLRGGILVDPRTQDFFRVAIEERHRLDDREDLSAEEKQWLSAFLKVLANGTGYGIYAEMNPQDLPKGEKRRTEVYGNWDAPFTAAVHAPEEPGAYCFPPFAACIAGAARLMLALLERCVTDAGGTHAMADTDSMAVVATEVGALVPCPGGPRRLPDGREGVHALSWGEVDRVRDRFATLTPYDPEAVPGSVLKLEKENQDPTTKEQRQLWCYAISAKRYALFNLDEHRWPVLRKWSEHGLGHLLNPTDPPDTEDSAEEDEDRADWMRTLWEGIVTETLGQPYEWPDWLDRPALGRIMASSPEMLRPFKTLNQGKPYAKQVKPYNFLLTAFVQRLGHPEGVDSAHFHLVAPFESVPRKWGKLPWTNLYDETGKRYTLRTGSTLYALPDDVHAKTYTDVLRDYRLHPESKSLAPDGTACTGTTFGLLRRRPVTALYLTHIGKESNRLEEVEAGLVHEPEEVYTEYVDPVHNAWQTLVIPVLKRMPRSLIMERTGLARSSIAEIRNGHAVPHPQKREALTQAATDFARASLLAQGARIPYGDLAVCMAYLQAPDG